MKILSIKVKPSSKRQLIQQEEDGSYTVYLKASPVDGKANAELIQLLAKTFEVPKSWIHIKTGTASKNKLVAIDLE